MTLLKLLRQLLVLLICFSILVATIGIGRGLNVPDWIVSGAATGVILGWLEVAVREWRASD